MEQIIIKHIDGTETSFPNRGLVAMITKAEQRVGLMGEDVLSVDITSANTIRFNIGDHIDVFGRTYTLNQLPSVKKNNSRSFNYTLIFESEQYELMNCAWLLPDETVGDSFTGTLGDFLKILVNTNLQRSYNNWILGTYPGESETKTLSFSDSNCLSVLQNLCSEFNVEFQIVRNGAERVLNIKTKIGDEFPFPFHYGRTGGLYNIDRKNNNNKNVVSRLYAFGSSQNIPSTYRHKRLCLPGKVKNESFIEDADNVAKFGHRENVHNFDDVKPERVGNVTVVLGSVLKFTDSTMFDLNEKKSDGSTKWLIPGTAAKIQFTTGNLAGYSFDVNNYVHSSHTFTINSFTDENGAVFPNPSSMAFQFADGDKYIITDIVLPDSYVADAEVKLAAKAREYYDEYCKPHVDYSIQVDSMYLKNILNDSEANAGTTNIFNTGDQIHIIDDDLGIDEKIRISQFTRDVLNPYSYNLTLSNDVQVSNLQRVIGDLSNINQVVQMNNLTDSARAKRNWRTTQEVLNSVFDPDGDYYTEKIKPNSIETQMLAVGARSQQFAIKGGLINANYGGDPNAIRVDSGLLEHYTIDADGVRVWTLSDSDVSDLDPDTTYYIYAKCDKNGDGGQIIFSDIQYQADAEGGYYYFLCGVLSSVMTGADGSQTDNPNPSRDVSLTYGSTTLNGRFINTGRIQSRNGETYFDLDSGEIGGNIDFQDSVITETILIKNGKSEDGQTQYCGAISGNTNYPVMWVSDQSTTDADAVKDLANGDCPVRITKTGIGSNIGCLNVSSKNNAVIDGNNGNVILSSDTIMNENAKLSPATIADFKPPHWVVYVLSLNQPTRGNPQTISNEYSNIVKIYDLPTSHNISVSSVANGFLSLVGDWSIGNDLSGAYPGVKITRVLQTYKSATNNGKDWVLINTQSIKVEKYRDSGDFTELREYALNFIHSGAKLFLMQKVTTSITTSRKKVEQMPKISATAEGDSVDYPKFHFVDILQSNIMAIGGYTCSLNSDNYFKLYPNTNKMNVDIRCGDFYINQFSMLNHETKSVSVGSSSMTFTRWGRMVFIQGHCQTSYLNSASFVISDHYKPVLAKYTLGWTSNANSTVYEVTISATGRILCSSLPSGSTIYFSDIYISTIS